MEKPILFNRDMVQAIIANTKNRTRRIVKPQPPVSARSALEAGNGTGEWKFFSEPLPHVRNAVTGWIKPPYSIGDRLWVRETWWERPHRTSKMMREGADTWPEVLHDSSVDDPDQLKEWGWKRRPSIHMPKWAARIWLTITNNRLERVQDVDTLEALYEGTPDLRTLVNGWDMRDCFRNLWRSLYGASWDRNDWVWVHEFMKDA